MAPEYAIDGVFSVKSDVFSFEILLLEIICGKKNRGSFHPEYSLNLVGHVSSQKIWLLFIYLFYTYYDTNNDKKVSNVLGVEIMERRKDFGANWYLLKGLLHPVGTWTLPPY